MLILILSWRKRNSRRLRLCWKVISSWLVWQMSLWSVRDIWFPSRIVGFIKLLIFGIFRIGWICLPRKVRSGLSVWFGKHGQMQKLILIRYRGFGVGLSNYRELSLWTIHINRYISKLLNVQRYISTVAPFNGQGLYLDTTVMVQSIKTLQTHAAAAAQKEWVSVG